MHHKIIAVDPTELQLPDGIEKAGIFPSLKKALSYEDKGITHDWVRWKKILARDNAWIERGRTGSRPWFAVKFGHEALEQKVEELSKERFKSCLYSKGGKYFTYSGLQSKVSEILELGVERRFDLPKFGLIPWKNKPHEMRPYQEKALNLMCPEDQNRIIAATSMGTGLGKTLVLGNIIKRVALPTVVVVPTLSIADQMLFDMKNWFGGNMVGQYFDGKKQSDKFIVIAVAKSLMNVGDGTADWTSFGKRGLLLADEAHTCPPDSLSTVLFGLLRNIPYRYFVSGTVFRNDGLNLLLQGITGDIVFEMSVEEGIEGKFLTPIRFYQWRVRSNSDYVSDEILKMNRVHLKDNENVYKHAANLANMAVEQGKRRVLILVDEVSQLKKLLDAGIRHKVGFAHGGLDKKNKDTVPSPYWKSDPRSLVLSFDRGEFPILVGTSCIGMGTDTKSPNFGIDLVGLTSEIRVRQSVGRFTRLFEGKKDAIYNDYNVYNIEPMERHAKVRVKIFNSIFGKVNIKDV